jgi:hypothetical protein
MYRLTKEDINHITSICYKEFFGVFSTKSDIHMKKYSEIDELEFKKKFSLVADYAKKIVGSTKIKEIIHKKYFSSENYYRSKLGSVDEVTQKCIELMVAGIDSKIGIVSETPNGQKNPEFSVFKLGVGQHVKQHALLEIEIEKIFNATTEYEAIKAEWNNLEVEDDFEPHDYMFNDMYKTIQGHDVIAARVRGKMHKHNGTHCDDWFEYASLGRWNIIAVSDGAGSKMFSRIGAKLSCRATIKSFQEQLQDFTFKCEDISAEKLDTQLLSEDQNELNQIIMNSVHAAKNSLFQFVEENKLNQQFTKRLSGRPIELNDLYSTLLLSIQTNITIKNEEYSLILSFQIGDGTIAVIFESGESEITCDVMGTADSGEYSSETEFLVSKKLTSSLISRISPKVINVKKFKGIMVMSDGVADDYFPASQEMNRLYNDLISYQIIERSEDKTESTNAASVRLQKWLDEYYKKGSFDDRTLVVMHREG